MKRYSVFLQESNEEGKTFVEHGFDTIPEVWQYILGEEYPLTITPTKEEEELAFEMRYNFALQISQLVQRAFVKNNANSQDEETATPEEVELALAPKDSPLNISQWNAKDLGLILLNSAYEPFTSAKRIEGDNVFWLNPDREYGLLTGLANIYFLAIFDNLERD